MARNYSKQDEELSRQWWDARARDSEKVLEAIRHTDPKTLCEVLNDKFFQGASTIDSIHKVMLALEGQEEIDMGSMMLGFSPDHVKLCDMMINTITRLKAMFLTEPEGELPPGITVYREKTQRSVLEAALEAAVADERYEDARVIKKQLEELA